MSSIKQDSYIAIVDCNNFTLHVKEFLTSLNNKPVIVLSNNDGCVIADSQEVKDLGIPMGIPVLKLNILLRFMISNFFIKFCVIRGYL